MDWGWMFWISLIGFGAIASMVNTYNDRKKWEAYYNANGKDKPKD